MESSDSKALDLAYLVAALVEEAGGRLEVSQSWFTSDENPFTGARLKLTSDGEIIAIELEEEN